MAIGELEPKQMRQSKQPEGEFVPDKGEAEQADRIVEKLEQPLPEDLVMDVDKYVGKRMQEQDSGNDLLGREVAEMLGSNTEESYIELVKDLRGHEGREAKSLNDVVRELPQLGDKERANILQALKVFSLALNEMQPAHKTAEEWEKLSEEEKDLVWVADITKRRVEIMAAEDIYNSDEVADKVKVKHALALGDELRAYGKEDALPETIKAEFELAANQANLFLKDTLRTKLKKKVPGQRSAVAEGNGRGGAAQAGAVDEVKGAGEVAEETLVPSAGETIVPAETVQKTPDQVETERVLAKDKIEPAREKAETETVKQRIFGREAIKKEDVKAIDKQLRELAEKGDAESAFELARELSHLRRAGIKLSGRGQEYYKDKLGAQVVAVRERGASAVAQYHVYLKYLGMESELSEQDRGIIRSGLREGVIGNRGKVASLTVNAKYLGVIKNADMMRDDLRADMKKQLNDRVNPEQVALEMARRKYLEVPYGLPDDQLHYQQRIDNQLDVSLKDGQCERYVKLKSYIDYVRGDERIGQGEMEKVVEYVEEAAERARQDGKWREYSSYIADAAYLSRRHEQIKGEGKPVARRDSSVDFVVNLEAEQEKLRAANKKQEKYQEEPSVKESHRERQTKAPKPREADARKEKRPIQPDGGKDGEADDASRSREVDPEQYLHRAKFARRAGEFNEAQGRSGWAGGNGKDILMRDRLELKWRENDLVRQRRELEQGGSGDNNDTRWANEAMEKLRRKADFSRVGKEKYLMRVLNEHKISGLEREARRRRYLNILGSEFGEAQKRDDKSMLGRVGSQWMERWISGFMVAKGWKKVQAAVPWGKGKRREVIRARQDTVKTMQEAAEDEAVDGRVRELLRRLAVEYELLNVREAKRLVKKTRSSGKRKKKKVIKQTPQSERGSGQKSTEGKDDEVPYRGVG